MGAQAWEPEELAELRERLTRLNGPLFDHAGVRLTDCESVLTVIAQAERERDEARAERTLYHGRLQLAEEQGARDESQLSEAREQIAGLEAALRDIAAPVGDGINPRGAIAILQGIARCYTTSEQHLSGARITVGFNTLEDAYAFQDALNKVSGGDNAVG